MSKDTTSPELQDHKPRMYGQILESMNNYLTDITGMLGFVAFSDGYRDKYKEIDVGDKWYLTVREHNYDKVPQELYEQIGNKVAKSLNYQYGGCKRFHVQSLKSKYTGDNYMGTYIIYV